MLAAEIIKYDAATSVTPNFYASALKPYFLTHATVITRDVLPVDRAAGMRNFTEFPYEPTVYE